METTPNLGVVLLFYEQIRMLLWRIVQGMVKKSCRNSVDYTLKLSYNRSRYFYSLIVALQYNQFNYGYRKDV
jgi:hypothetical protein